MVTIKDVAEAAQVSIATVSNYINQTKPVSAPTERRIKDAIESLNYVPNLLAKGLKAHISNDIGVVLPDLNDSHFAQIYQGIAREFQGSKYFLNLAFSKNIPEIERKTVDNFLNKKICGLILVTCIPDDWHYYYDRFSSQDRPLVLIDRMIYDLDCNFVAFDNRKTLSDMVTRLLDNGTSNIYLFTGSDTFSCENECVEGFKAAFTKAGLPPPENQIVTNVMNKEDAFRQMIRSIQNFYPVPEVVITTSELSAQGAIEALTLLGYTQKDLPVITLGEEHWNRYTHSFASSSILRPAIKMGATAASILQKELLSPKTHEKTVIILDSSVIQPGAADFWKSPVNIKPSEQKKIRALLLDTYHTTALQGFLPNFEKATGISVSIEVLPHRYLLERIMQESGSDKSQSDVYMFDIPWLYDLSSAGILADITDYFKNPLFDENIFLPNCLKYFSEFQGRLYGFPILYGPQILYYRKDLFENTVLSAEYAKQFKSKLTPPRTWKEFLAVAEFFTTCDMQENTVRYGTSMPGAYKECMVPEIYVRLFSYGGEVFDKRNRVVLNTPHALKAYINFLQTFKYSKPDYLSATDTSVVTDFLNGETAMLVTFPSFLTEMTDLRHFSLTGEIGYNLIPGRTTLLGGWSAGISSRSGKKDEAFRFLSWTASKEIANCLTLMGGQTAVKSIFDNDELVTLYPWLPLYQRAYQYTVPILPPYQNGKQIVSQDEIDTIIHRYALELIMGNQDVTTTIEKTHDDLNALFLSSNI